MPGTPELLSETRNKNVKPTDLKSSILVCLINWAAFRTDVCGMRGQLLLFPDAELDPEIALILDRMRGRDSWAVRDEIRGYVAQCIAGGVMDAADGELQLKLGMERPAAR